MSKTGISPAAFKTGSAGAHLSLIRQAGGNVCAGGCHFFRWTAVLTAPIHPAGVSYVAATSAPGVGS